MKTKITANYQITKEDYDLITNTIRDFSVLYNNSEITNFYTTLFFEEKNRKINLNFAFGRCIKCRIEKISEVTD